MNQAIPTLIGLASVTCLAGCATVSTIVEEIDAAPSDGLAYYMPMRPIVVKITRDEASTSEKHTIEVQAGEAYADLSRRYVLRMPSNAIAQRKLKIGVTAQGLLSSATAEPKSQVSEALKGLAATAGTSRVMSTTPMTEVQPACQPGRSYTLILNPGEVPAAGTTLCKFKITVESLGFTLAPTSATRPTLLSSVRHNPVTSKREPPPRLVSSDGVFYRQTLPYRVTVSDPEARASGPSTQFLVFSPSEAPVLFLPAKKSLFASSNKLDLVFTDGVITSYSQDIDGEVVALFKLPADILAAYFDAIGSILPKKTTAITTEKEYLDAMNELAVAKLKEQKCRAAVDEGNADKIKKECGSAN